MKTEAKTTTAHHAFTRTFWVNLYPSGEMTSTLCATEQEALNRSTYTDEIPDATQVEIRIVPVGAKADDLKPTIAIRELSDAVLNECSCGGGGPECAHTCPACHVYHRLVSLAPELLATCEALIAPRVGPNKKAQYAAARMMARDVIARAHSKPPNTP